MINEKTSVKDWQSQVSTRWNKQLSLVRESQRPGERGCLLPLLRRLVCKGGVNREDAAEGPEGKDDLTDKFQER